MKTIQLVIISMLISFAAKTQDLTYDGPGKGEVHSFWINAMGIKKTGKIEEGIIIMEAKLEAVKQKAPNYNTADMVAEIKKWKDKLAATSSKPVSSSGTSTTPSVTPPQNRVDIKNLVISTPPAGYSGPAKDDVAYYYTSAGEAKENIIARKFTGADSKIRKMENAAAAIKMKDPAYNVGALSAEINSFKAAIETVKYNIVNEKESKNNNAANEQAAANVLKELFGMDNLDFRSDQFPLRAMIVQKHKASLQTYLALSVKASASVLEGYRKNNDMFFLTHTNMTLKKFENFLPTAKGTDWVEGIYYSLQYHQSFWDAAQKIYPQETDFTAMYQKVTTMVNNLGSMDAMKNKGNAANAEAVKNRKLPPAVMKDANAEKMIMDAFNKLYSTDYKGTAIKAITLQSEWHPVKNDLTGVILGRQRQFAIVYKGTDGKCFLVNSIYLYQEYNGSGYANTTARYAANSGTEMLCANAN